MGKHSASHKIDDVQLRRDELQNIMMDYAEKGIHLSWDKAIEELKMRKIVVSRATFHRDWVDVSRKNTFVRDIAESTYSQHINDIFEILRKIEDRYWEWMTKPPQIYKAEMEPGKNGKNKTTKSIVETLSPLMIAKALVEIADIKGKLLSGNVVNTSVHLLTNKLSKLEYEVQMAEVTKTVKIRKFETGS